MIDLELQLQQDRTAPLETLLKRDAAIAEKLEGRGLEGRERLLGWLDELRAGGPPSAGQRVAEVRELAAAALGWVGLFTGVSLVGGWLHAGSGVPVNVIHFWPAIVGSQLLLLAVLAAIALPTQWLRFVPGLRAAQSLLRGAGARAAALASALLQRVSPTWRELAPRLERLRGLDWLYGRLHRWLWIGLTQSFALGFNIGALLAFVVLPSIDDPAFGWRSRLLEPATVERVAGAVALPWRAALPQALPSREAIEATRYSSIEPRFAREPREQRGPDDPWAAWFPFLLASLLVYGFAPRLALWTTARVAVARELRRAPLAHADAARLRERLERTPLDTRATLPEHEPDGAPASARALVLESAPDLSAHAVHALCWAGVPLRADELQAQLRERSGAAVAAVTRVGGIDPGDDARALAALREAPAPRAAPAGAAAVLFVEAWEPPVADYMDFLHGARRALGPGAPLVVWLVEHEPRRAGAARSDSAGPWQRRLAALGDPWLRLVGAR